jgi:hypothetical protein
MNPQLPERLKGDYDTVYEPGPIRRFLAGVLRVVGEVLRWM